MSATDELRRLLDERGVKWWPMHDDEAGYHEDRDTEFLVYGCKHVAHEWGCRLQVGMLTPEQAIAATLGARTCELVNAADDLGNGTSSCMCDKCGYTALDDWWDEFNFCPHCGRRVVDE